MASQVTADSLMIGVSSGTKTLETVNAGKSPDELMFGSDDDSSSDESDKDESDKDASDEDAADDKSKEDGPDTDTSKDHGETKRSKRRLADAPDDDGSTSSPIRELDI